MGMLAVREKRPTVRELAKETGVSIATVSRFLNQDYRAMSAATRQRIQEAVERSGYVYTKNREQGMVGVVLPNLTDPFFAQILSALAPVLDQAGLSMQLCLTQDSLDQERRCIRRLLGPEISGILYMSTVSSEENCFDLLKEAGKPFVVLDSYLSEYNAPALAFSNGVYGMYAVTQYLLQAGHEKIAYLSGLRAGMFEHYRYQGYVNGLLDSGHQVNPNLVRFTGFGIQDGMESFQDLLDSGEQFTAVICESDQMAAGVYKVCYQNRIAIPDQLSVVGYNNSLVAQLVEPPLTSVDQRVDLLTAEAVEMLQKQIRGEQLSERVKKITPQLVFRASVKELAQRDPGKELL